MSQVCICGRARGLFESVMLIYSRFAVCLPSKWSKSPTVWPFQFGWREPPTDRDHSQGKTGLPSLEVSQVLPARRYQIRDQGWSGRRFICPALIPSFYPPVLSALEGGMGLTLIYVGLFDDHRGLQHHGLRPIPRHFTGSFVRDRILVYNERQRFWSRISGVVDGRLDGIYHHCSRQWAHGPVYYAHV